MARRKVRKTHVQKSSKDITSFSDSDLEQVLKQIKANIKIIGTGGSGNNTLKRISEIGIEGVELVAVNTDAQHLLMTPADKKVLIGEKVTRGLGAGSDPSLGEAAAKESVDRIAKALSGADMVFVTCGLGGGTGTGSIPVIAEVAKDLDALTVAIVTLPFSAEGRKRMENAIEGLKKLKKTTDTLIVVPNDKLLELVPDLPLNQAFKVADEVLANAVKGISELITKPGLIQLDFADVKAVLTNSGPAMIGIGESSADSPETRALEAAEDALSSPLLDIDISESTRALINVTGSKDMSLKEAELVVEALNSKIHKDALVIWGAMVDEKLQKNTVRVLTIVAGGKISYLEDYVAGDLDIDIKTVD